MELSVVVPVHDEAEAIEPLLAEVENALAGMEYEAIWVDDGSADATPLVLRRLLASHPALRVLRHRERSGQSAALWTGIESARARWVATLDGDGQNDPADIPRLLEARGSPEPDLVAGIRARRRDRWLKRASSVIANGVRRGLLRDGVSDTGCGLKLIRREAFLGLPRFDHMHRFLPALVRAGGGRVVTVDVRHRPRLHGRTKYGIHNRLWVGIVDLFGVMWLRRRTVRPAVEELEAPDGVEKVSDELDAPQRVR